MEKKTITQVRAMLKKMKHSETITVTMYPSNVRPGNMWLSGFTAVYGSEGFRADTMDVRTFQDDVNSFTYYNCNNELGRYVHFYVERNTAQCECGHADCVIHETGIFQEA